MSSTEKYAKIVESKQTCDFMMYSQQFNIPISHIPWHKIHASEVFIIQPFQSHLRIYIYLIFGLLMLKMICSKSIMIGRSVVTNIPRSSFVTSNSPLYRIISNAPQTLIFSSRRHLSTSRSFSVQVQNDAFPPPPHLKGAKIQFTEPAWKHPVFTGEQMEAIQIAHRPTTNTSDNVALFAVKFLRTCMDKVTGYRHPKDNDGDDPVLAEKAKMTEKKWLIRMIFLESVAAVPGMVGGMLRHLHSLRRMKRDNGWIESLLEEAFNERMHLLTFLKLYSPGLFMRLMILGAQGVFFNGFFLCYLVSPRTCHRFVGYLEEEAVITYTRALADIDAGKLPLWKNLEAPQIAVTYWNMPEGHRMMKDLLLYVRADEAKHREVNHTLGNLDQISDPNPFVSQYADESRPHPSKLLKDAKSTGWAREEAL